jgi:uncharacterized protein (DUF433 family)
VVQGDENGGGEEGGQEKEGGDGRPEAGPSSPAVEAHADGLDPHTGDPRHPIAEFGWPKLRWIGEWYHGNSEVSMNEDRPITLADGSVVHSDSEILGGTPAFVGTRVPVQTLVDYLEGGYSVDEFLDNFPSVHRAQVNAFLEQATRALLAKVA